MTASADLPSSDGNPAGPGRTGHDPLEGRSPDGLILTGACRDRIVPAFRPVIDQAIQRVTASGEGHSLYLYGSVATGMARSGISDVDLVSVGLNPAAAADIGRSLTAAFATLCRSVDIGAARQTDYEGEGDEAHGNRVFLRHYCVHLAGPDIGQGLPRFRADAAAARGFNGDIGRCAARWRAEAQQAPGPALLGRRVARKTLLALAGLVSVVDATWTTDRVGAARRWGALRPAWAAPLQELVLWSSSAGTGPSRLQVQAALDGVVDHVVNEFRQAIGLWR